MKPILRVLLSLLAACCLSSCTAESICPSTDKVSEWPDTCFVAEQSGERNVRLQYVPNIKVNRYGVALIMIEDDRELVAVDAAGKVVIPGIRYTGDFDYPHPPEGLGRYDVPARDRMDGGKQQCGYFDVHTFKIVIPATYDYCERFDERTAKVCNDCVEYCTVAECQNSIAVGGRAMLIDPQGKPVRHLVQPSLADICRSRGKMVKVRKTISSRLLLECVPEGAANGR